LADAAAQAQAVSRLAARLRFRHLQLLVALQRDGSLRAAAQVLNLTQPALSKALGEIESAFGFALFDRSTRGLTPTPRGAVAVRGAERLLQELAHLHGEASAGERGATLVRVGAPPFVAQGYLPAVFARLVRPMGRDAPPVRVALLEERVPVLLEALAAGRLDALVTSYPLGPVQPDAAIAAPVALRYENLFDAKFLVIAPPGHPLARARRVSWQRLAAESWVMPGPTSLLRRVLEESFRQGGAITPEPLVESVSPMTNVQLVAAGLGLGAAPEPAARHALSLGQVRRVAVDPPLAAGPVALVSRAGVPNPRLDLLRAALHA
jgi:DNA-binding transcriptional LysR family regulator